MAKNRLGGNFPLLLSSKFHILLQARSLNNLNQKLKSLSFNDGKLIKIHPICTPKITQHNRNSIRNGMWPTSVNNLYLACILFYLSMASQPRFLSPINHRLWSLANWINSTVMPCDLPEMLRAFPVAVIGSFSSMCVVMFVRQLLLRALLSYRGWMYVSLRSPPLRIQLWGLLVRLVSGYQPSLYSFQRSLPRMSVPSLSGTFSKLLESMEPIMSREEFRKFQKDVQDFSKTLAPKLQRLLILKSWLAQNYVSDWWVKYVYLMNRWPLANKCNYYIMDQSYWRATDKPVPRAASLVANLLRFKTLIDREELPPLVLRDTIPICMAQYEQLYSTARVPKKEIDELVHYETYVSKHIVVVCRGVYYKLTCYDHENNPLSAKKLEEYFQIISDDAEKSCQQLTKEERTISGLTALERTDWAQLREKLMLSEINRKSLHLVESAMFMVWIFPDDKPKELSDRAKIAFQGNSEYRFWFDKCFNVVIFGDGHCALNCEHTVCDAPAYAHMWEYTLCKDVLECTFDYDGTCFPPFQTYRQVKSEKPSQISWDVRGEAFKPLVTTQYTKQHKKSTDILDLRNGPQSANLVEDIQRANRETELANADVDLRIFDHDKWGKGAIKKCRVSPDAFVQIAIQLAYFKQAGKFVQTYEASMTRLYLQGRTETVRSCTSESCKFVEAMLDPNSNNEQRIKLLHLAAEKHTVLYKDAMNGKGIDRHLFALYVASKGLGYECKFLGDLLMRPWILSTSQTPHTQQTNVPDPNFPSFNDKLCSGGGFMAVADDGYGISYLFPSDQRIFFHISSRKSSPQTDTTEFGRLLFESLTEIKALFELATEDDK